MPEPIHSLRKAAPCAKGGKNRPDVLLVRKRKTLPQLAAPVLNGSLQIALGQTGQRKDRQFTSGSRVQVGAGLVQKPRRRFGYPIDLTDGTDMLRRQTFQNPFGLRQEVGLSKKPEAIAQIRLCELSGFQHQIGERHTALRQRLLRSPERLHLGERRGVLPAPTLLKRITGDIRIVFDERGLLFPEKPPLSGPAQDTQPVSAQLLGKDRP